MQLVWAERSYRVTTGFALSVLFHIALALAVILVSLYHPLIEPTPPPGIEATIVSDITAAPKVDKPGKLQDKPKPPTPPAPEQKKPEPPKPTPPVTPTQAAPPPPSAEAKAVDIPDETKKAEQKKPEEKKPEEKKNEKKADDKKKKQQDQDFAALLNNLAKDQPAPDTKEKTKPKAKPAPAEPTTGPQAALLTDGPPMTASDNDFIRTQLIPCWSFDAGVPNPENYTVVVRITVREDGAVTAAQLEDTSRLGDPTYRSVAETALRAVENPSCVPLKLPQGKYWPQMDVVFDLGKAISGGY